MSDQFSSLLEDTKGGGERGNRHFLERKSWMYFSPRLSEKCSQYISEFLEFVVKLFRKWMYLVLFFGIVDGIFKFFLEFFFLFFDYNWIIWFCKLFGNSIILKNLKFNLDVFFFFFFRLSFSFLNNYAIFWEWITNIPNILALYHPSIRLIIRKSLFTFRHIFDL